MNTVTKIADGLWHIKKFVDDAIWQDVSRQILELPDSLYTLQHEPMRIRYEIFRPTDLFGVRLKILAHKTLTTVKNLTNNKLITSPGLFLWRDLENFKSDWHPDDFTVNPTAQIYVAGDISYGTSFRINNSEITLPFEPNTGYLMDNRLQIVHGMLTPIGKNTRQSIYLTY